MRGSDIAIRPLAVALRGEQGSVALFECVMPSEMLGGVKVWATCGARKRFPVPARVTRDDVMGESRVVVACVQVPPLYSACTLHVSVRSGVRLRFASCRIDDAHFRTLAPAARNPENDYGYHDWFLAHRAKDGELARQRQVAREWERCPLVSIVTPVFRTPAAFLSDFIDSVLGQTYDNFELIIVNVSGECAGVDEVLARYGDRRLRVVVAPNKTIPENTNVGIEAARGDYVAFIDHDDFVEPDILFRYVETILAHPESDLLFCDEDLWSESEGGGRFCGARFKFGWNPDLLFSYNYVCHMLMVSRWALDRTERSGAEVNGAQDYDLTLKVAEVARDIRHVPGMLYHWRTHPASTASNRKSKPYAGEAGRLAVQGHFDRVGLQADVVLGSAPFSYRVLYAPARAAEVSIVVYEDACRAPAERLADAIALGGKVELIGCGRGFLNEAIGCAHGRIVVVVGSLVEVSGSAWVDELTRQLSRPEVACSAPLLVDRSGIVRSAGLARGIDGGWHHYLAGYPCADVGYLAMLDHVHDRAAVSLQCLALKKEVFERGIRFDERLEGDAAAIDFCARVHDAGMLTVLAPAARVCLSGRLEGFACDDEGLPRSAEYARLVSGDPYGESRLVGDDGNVCVSDFPENREEVR